MQWPSSLQQPSQCPTMQCGEAILELEASNYREAMKSSNDSCEALPFPSHLIFMTIGRYVRLRVPELWMSSPPARCPCPPHALQLGPEKPS